MASWADIQRGIFAGESGGDYDALYGFRNRSGPFQGTRVSQMPISDVLAFTDPSGPYAQSVKSEIGRVATPVGAYQVVGSTLRDAVDALGLDPSQTFDQATQDKIGQWILSTQGTGAWEGYKGPRMSTSNSPQSIAADTMAALGMRGREMPQQQPMGLLEQLGIQKMGSGGPQGDVPFYQRDRFKDTAGSLALALNDMQLRPSQGLAQNVAMGRQRRDANRTADWLEQQPGGAPFAQAIRGGGDPAQMLTAYRTDMKGAANVQASQMLPDMSGTVMTMRDGSVRVVTAGGETLAGEAALEFIRAANETYTTQQRDIYGARREGTLGADIDLGGQASAAVEEGKASVAKADDYLTSAELASSMITNLSDAILAIDQGANSGVIYKMLPAIDEETASLRNSMDRLGLDVVGSVTFGALSENELKLAMETAVPRNLGPTELRSWLVKKREAQVKTRQGLLDAAAHFAKGGTMAEWIEMYGGRQSFPGEKPEDKVLTYDPATGEFK